VGELVYKVVVSVTGSQRFSFWRKSQGTLKAGWSISGGKGCHLLQKEVFREKEKCCWQLTWNALSTWFGSIPGFFFHICGEAKLANEAKCFYIHPHYGCKIKYSPILILFSSNFWLLLYNP
jgi:hypothetical protein